MIEQSCQCDECQVSRRQEPDTTHFADDATLSRIAELERKNAELRKDAERYRKLLRRIIYRNHPDGFARATMDWCVSASSGAPESIDEALDSSDAAIASEKENERG